MLPSALHTDIFELSFSVACTKNALSPGSHLYTINIFSSVTCSVLNGKITSLIFPFVDQRIILIFFLNKYIWNDEKIPLFLFDKFLVYLIFLFQLYMLAINGCYRSIQIHKQMWISEYQIRNVFIVRLFKLLVCQKKLIYVFINQMTIILSCFLISDWFVMY